MVCVIFLKNNYIELPVLKVNINHQSSSEIRPLLPWKYTDYFCFFSMIDILRKKAIVFLISLKHIRHYCELSCGKDTFLQ